MDNKSLAATRIRATLWLGIASSEDTTGAQLSSNSGEE
jgi:hypothetical protein